jgi:cyclopropane fatty-acyl-phospholipid synthase-like methyltransferase
LDIGRTLHAERPDLQKAFRLDDPDQAAAFWYWLHWQGREDVFCRLAADVRRLVWPSPPSHLLGRVVGEESDTESFDKGGLVDWRRIRRCLVNGGFDFEKGGALLDFGVGCGRILRYFALYGRTCRIVGADVDEEAVAWCREHLDFASFEAIPFQPPTSFRDGEFSAVYAFSVFSHLPERRHLDWLAELHRITHPGAILVLTTMGRHCARQVIEGKREYPHPRPQILARDFQRMEQGELLFYPYESLSFQHQENVEHFSEWDMATYGSTYMTEDYIRRAWTPWFDVVAFESAPDNWQDYVTLKRR